MPEQLLLELKRIVRAVPERTRTSVTMEGFIVNDKKQYRERSESYDDAKHRIEEQEVFIARGYYTLSLRIRGESRLQRRPVVISTFLLQRPGMRCQGLPHRSR